MNRPINYFCETFEELYKYKEELEEHIDWFESIIETDYTSKNFNTHDEDAFKDGINYIIGLLK